MLARAESLGRESQASGVRLTGRPRPEFDVHGNLQGHGLGPNPTRSYVANVSSPYIALGRTCSTPFMYLPYLTLVHFGFDFDFSLDLRQYHKQARPAVQTVRYSLMP